MDILLIILGILCLIVGLAGCILPMIPGPPVAYAGLLLLHFTDKAQFSTTQLLLWLAAVVLVQILEVLAVDTNLRELLSRTEGGLGNASVDDVLQLGSYESCAFSGLNMLEFDNLIYVAILLDGNAVSEVTGCDHVDNPPGNI